MKALRLAWHIKMLQIKCPWCGERDENEFTFGGEAGRSMPDTETVNDRDWSDYLFNRINPRGLHREQWQHAFGCRQWFVVDRDTVTHEIVKTMKIKGLIDGNG